ncbi:NADPH:quinone reductase [Streptomyces longisporoflavus]|uniref:NADP-dependent oxidoreductase n=1 Tax=Streptomyces longisporoflavus TaxID=28044 RepID=UPI00167CF367|nr:NADP-dependent oxidoreductase [Streptomyces longisporoflavus]GGV65025.1 NADPH:quinone reductase [Streptomyces longisporoflavus]
MAGQDTMQAAVIDGFGAPGVLHAAAHPVPVPGEGEVLVRVHAAGVNAIDWATRAGQGVGVSAFPAVLGWDISGTVAAVGPGTSRLRVGDAVFGMPRFPGLAGGYAQFAVADENELALKPAGVDDVVAASAPMVVLTAWQTLYEHGGLESGQRVLVQGASGGVGHIAVQLAAAAGAEVIGTASVANHGFVRSLGAHDVVEHDAVGRSAKDVDIAVDPRGGADFRQLLDVLRPGGIVVTLKGEADGHRAAARERGVRAGFTYVRPNRAVLEQAAPMLADGRLQPYVQEVLPLEGAARAHEIGEQGHVRGRLVLDLR